MIRPKVILFDWDNTLVDSWGTIHHALVETFASLGVAPWTLEETKRRVRHSLRDAFPPLFGARWEEAKRLYIGTFTAIHLERLKALEGAEAALRELAGAGFRLGVVSNKTGALLRREVVHLAWERFFVRVVGAGDASHDKPHAAPIQLALDGSGQKPGPEIWYVGDTELDMECAANAGCPGILIGEAEGARFATVAALVRSLAV
ncbi:MAG TPA: HAD family hydrolase [Stellaceae bacterium]|nr:HAD family hydrolase [Stellaceae bacterium]